MKGEKQMKNFILKNKIKILCILLFSFLLVFLNNNVFASSDITFTDKNGNVRTIPSINSDLVYNGYILKEYNNAITLFLFEEQPTIYVYNDGYNNMIASKKALVYFLEDNTFVRHSEADYDANNTFMIYDEVLYTTLDLYDYDNQSVIKFSKTGDNFFFQMVVLQEVMEGMEKEAVMKEIVGILPVIMSVVVSLIALRKALQMLLNFLRKS